MQNRCEIPNKLTPPPPIPRRANVVCAAESDWDREEIKIEEERRREPAGGRSGTDVPRHQKPGSPSRGPPSDICGPGMDKTLPPPLTMTRTQALTLPLTLTLTLNYNSVTRPDQNPRVNNPVGAEPNLSRVRSIKERRRQTEFTQNHATVHRMSE